MSDFGVVVMQLGVPRHNVHAHQPCRVALHRNAQLPRLVDNRLAPLRPEGQKVRRHTRDPRVLAVRPISLHVHTEALVQVPCEIGPEQRPRRLGPAIDRMLMMRPALAVPPGSGDVQDDTADVDLRVAVLAPAMQECRSHQVRWNGLDGAAPAVSDPRITAIFEHRVLQRRPCRIDAKPLDRSPHIGFRDGPQRGDALVR